MASKLDILTLLVIDSLTSHDGEMIQPQPPTTFNFHDQKYFLQTSLSVRQAIETIQLSTSAGEDLARSVPTRVITESLLDLESNQKFTSCQVCAYGRIIEPSHSFHDPRWCLIILQARELGLSSLHRATTSALVLSQSLKPPLL